MRREVIEAHLTDLPDNVTFVGINDLKINSNCKFSCYKDYLVVTYDDLILLYIPYFKIEDLYIAANHFQADEVLIK